MKKLSQAFKTHLVREFKDSLSSGSNTEYYMTIGNSLVWQDDLSPPNPILSISQDYKNREEILFGKKLSPSDVAFGIKYVLWEPSQVYQMYDDTIEDLDQKNFYVVSEEIGDYYSVFKCLGNNNGLPVFARPSYTETSESDSYYRTADKYEWKFMFSVPGNEFRKFASSDIIPVVRNSSVISNALSSPNGIEHIKVIEGGTNYNSYAYGSIQESEVAGDPLIYSLETDDNQTLYTYDVYDQFSSQNPNKPFFFKRNGNVIWEVAYVPVQQQFYSELGSTIRCFSSERLNIPSNITKIYQTSNNLSGGTVTYESFISSYRQDVLPNLSSNTDFYKNNLIYIRSGVGAGQIKKISEYIVTGNQRRVLIDQPFTTVPDAASKFEILPALTITGDGTGAVAIPVMDTSSNSIIQVEILTPGTDYTYATASVTANTGSVLTSNCVLRPIISPIGGHGSDPESELFSNTIIISKEFDSDESGRISTQNDYRTITVLKDPEFDNVTLELDISSLSFIDGEKVVQITTGATGYVVSRLGVNLTLSNVKGIFLTSEIISTTRPSSNITADVLSINKDMSIFDNRVKLSIQMTYTGTDGTGFLEDDEVFQVSPASAKGYVHSSSSTLLGLTKSRGVWNVSDDLSSVLVEVKNTRNEATAKITGKLDSDLSKNTGKILYVENLIPVKRNPGQKEQIKLYISF